MPSSRHPGGVVIFEDVPFFLAKDSKGVPQWSRISVPTQEGDPLRPRNWRWNDWSKGMGDSRGIFRGAVEYAENAYLGDMGRILPGPKPTAHSTANGATVTAIVEVTLPARRLLVFGGTTVKSLDSAHTVATDYTGPLPAAALDACLFVDQVAVAIGDSSDYFRRNASGTYSVNSIAYKARTFGLSGNDLVRGTGTSWAKCSAADFYSSTGNWSALYTIGNQARNVNKVFGHQRWDYVLKDEGLYTFDQDNSDEILVLADLASFPSTENRGWGAWGDHLFVCSVAGLYRYLGQGVARTVGIEEAKLNEGTLINVYPTAHNAFGQTAYVAYYSSALDTTYLCLMRRAQDGDASFGSPYTVTSVIDTFTGLCRVIGPVSDISGAFRLYYSAGVNVRSIAVGQDGKPIAYRDSGTATIWFPPTDFGLPMTMKYFRSIEAIVRSLSAARNLQWKGRLDGGAAANVGAAITTTGTGVRVETFWTKDTSDAGRTLQLGAFIGLDSTTVAPEIREVIVNYEERPIQVAGARFSLRLRDQDTEGPVSTRKSAREMQDLLDSYLDGVIVDCTDAYGDSYACALSMDGGRADWQRRGDDINETIDLTLRRLDYS